jgi:hypothetical protein
VSGTESDRWQSGVNVGKVVVVEGDAEVAGVLGTVAIRVTDERSLPLLDRSAADCYTTHRVGIHTWSWNLLHDTVT